MKFGSTVLAACLGLAALTGCRPDVERLVHRGAYDEAICAATHYSRGESDPGTLGPALDRLARPRLHLATLSAGQLEQAYGAAGRRLAAAGVLVRGTTAIDALGVDDFGLSLTLIGPQGPIPQGELSREGLAALTGEALPEAEVIDVPLRRRLVRERWRERPLRGWVAGALEASTLFLVPVTVITGHSEFVGGYRVRVPPSDAELLAAAPVAETLFLAAHEQSGAQLGPEGALESAEVWIWPRLADEGRVPLSLEIEWVYATGGCAPPGAQLRRAHGLAAEVRGRARVELPPGPDLEARLRAVFGDRMRPLEDLR